jgi:hypothetical protein
MRFALRHADTVIANSDYTRDILLGMGIAGRRIAIINPGVDIDMFRPGLDVAGLRENLRIPSTDKLVFSVGRLSRRKGFDQTVRAVARLRAEGHPVSYVLAGIGEDADYLDGLIAEYSMEGSGPSHRPVEGKRSAALDECLRRVRHAEQGDPWRHGRVRHGFIEAAACRKPAFPQEAQAINYNNIIKAIASFQRTLISGNSRYDQYNQQKAQLSESELRGKNLFFGEKAECFHCHGSFNLNDQVVHAGTRVLETPFHNTGLFNIGGTGDFPFPNRGVFELSGKAQDMGKFRASSLRNIELTAPYMHDGSIATLEQVLDFYAEGGRNITEGVHAGDGRNNPFKSELVTLIDLNAQEKADIVAFLKTLTDNEFIHNPKISDPFKQP